MKKLMFLICLLTCLPGLAACFDSGNVVNWPDFIKFDDEFYVNNEKTEPVIVASHNGEYICYEKVTEEEFYSMIGGE